jgi:hypothetical protein
VAFLAMVGIAVVAAIVVSVVDDSAADRYSTGNVRL